jgi:type II secretory pathway component PulF
MQSATLAQYIALNDQLIGLVRAGVPVHLGVGQSADRAAAALERISAIVARRVGEGASVVQALDDRDIPAAYRSVAQLALASGDLSTALTAASRKAQALDDSWHALRVSLVYPLVICGLAYMGFVLFAWLLVPHLQHAYQDMRLEAGSGMRVANSLRASLPYWIAIPPLALLLIVVLGRRASPRAAGNGRSAGLVGWLPGMSQAASEHRLTSFAETLASLLDAGLPLPEGLRLAAANWEDTGLERETLSLAQSLERDAALADDSRIASEFPPFLRWAIWHGDGPVGRARALRMAANVYRQSAQRRIGRLRVAVPIVACIVLGGGVTLLYALTLFVPVAQMLRGLAA